MNEFDQIKSHIGWKLCLKTTASRDVILSTKNFILSTLITEITPILTLFTLGISYCCHFTVLMF